MPLVALGYGPQLAMDTDHRSDPLALRPDGRVGQASHFEPATGAGHVPSVIDDVDVAHAARNA